MKPAKQHHDVRITVTIDDDVAALLEKDNRRAKEPMKQTVNRILRAVLTSDLLESSKTCQAPRTPENR